MQSAKYIEADEFRQYIELEVLKVLQNLNANPEITTDRIQEVARHVLLHIKPGMPLDELYRAAIQLDDEYSELAPVVILLMREYETKYEQKALTQVSDLIKSGKYDEAQDIVKKVLMYKIS